MKKKIFLIIILVLIFPVLAFAHQPRITSSAYTIVPDPEISKAYYSKLDGEAQSYEISSEKSFTLYLNILVPDIDGQKKDVSAIVIKEEDTSSAPLALLNGVDFTWEKFFEPYGHDTYWKGPEYKAEIPAGKYLINVSSSSNDSKYALAIGEKENFNFKETMNDLHLVPQLKKTFFNESPIDFIFSPFGWGLLLAFLVISVIIYFPMRFAVIKYWGKYLEKIKNKKYLRIIEFILGLALLIFIMLTTWNIWLIILAISTILESIFWF